MKNRLMKQLRRKARQDRRIESRMFDHIRATPSVEGMNYRSSSLAEINDQERTVVATLSTEQPVPMYDYRTRAVIDEVLMAGGGRFPERMPMLDDHSRWGANSVLGSIRNPVNSGDRWRGTLHFAVNAGDQVDQIWEKVRQGHITDVSVGYRYGEGDYVDIAPGQTRKVKGREYTASQSRVMRVVTNWSAREASVTPIGADDMAKIGRSDNGGTSETPNLEFSFEVEGNFQSPNQRAEAKGQMKKYLQWLHARGMAESITEQAAALDWARRNLAGELLSQFADVCRSDEIEFKVEQQRSESPAPTPATPVAAPSTAEADLFRAARERAAYVSQIGDGVLSDVRTRAITENWDIARINAEFAKPENRQQRSEPISGQAPAGHVVNREINQRALQAALLMRAGIDIEHNVFRTQQAQHVLGDRTTFRMANGNDPRERADWMVQHSRNLSQGGSTRDDSAARAVDAAYRLQRMSMIDVCAAALEIEGVDYDRYDRDEIIQRSFSTATLNAIFTTNFAAQMLAGFVDAPDTTVGWTAEAELPNFQTVERFQMRKTGKLRRTDRNQTPADDEVEATLESYKLVRYAERFVVDEMDIIDDRFGALDTGVPRDMGEAARVIRPDLVYTILLGNPTMQQDAKALFHVDHGNFVSSGAGLSLATLDTAKAAMASQTSNGRLLDIRANYLIVPESRAWAAKRLLGSDELRDNTSNAIYGTMNPAKGSFQVVSDARLDSGIADPSSLTGATNAGEPGSWLLATAGGRYGIEVGHLRGTGRAPVVRRFELTEGRIGIGWVCIMYNAAKAIGWQGLSKQRT